MCPGPEVGPENEDFGEDVERAAISTGHLPSFDRVEELLQQARYRYADVDDGAVADYIPTLARAERNLYGLAVTEVNGSTHTAGDAWPRFSIQSISKAFVYGVLCRELPHRQVWEKIGVNNTGLPFNSVMALELNAGAPRNPMVNAGALAATSLVPGGSSEAKWQLIQESLSAFAGRRLELDVETYESEAATNQRNRALARLLDSYGHLYFDPEATTDIYTKTCSLLVSVTDLATMGATLADGGVNPVTGERVVDSITCRHVLASMAASGLYERSGDWLYDIGMPGKSGVSGGIITVSPGKGCIATFSPPLDPAGNSVRGQRATRFLSRTLGLNLFASRPD
ncbi:glutaminase A [Arthrobacter castelli]|uniref:glutaminase A n=1 Tax=Arthrobacter castelli TaxID=271431 RepID=UPI00041884EE|nr:glutaminase A [Arthrobacter castelli]